MLTLAALRELAERLPDGAALTLPKAALLEALGIAADASGSAGATPFRAGKLRRRCSKPLEEPTS